MSLRTSVTLSSVGGPRGFSSNRTRSPYCAAAIEIVTRQVICDVVLGSALTLPATPTRSGLCLLVALRRLSWSGLYSVQEPNREGLASCAADSAEPAPSANFVNSVLTDCCAARNIRATTHNATSPHALLTPPPLLPPPPLRPLACVHDEAAGRLKNGAARRVNNSLLY